MQNVSIQANVVTVSTESDSGIESGDEEGPPPAPGTESDMDVTQKQLVSGAEGRSVLWSGGVSYIWCGLGGVCCSISWFKIGSSNILVKQINKTN